MEINKEEPRVLEYRKQVKVTAAILKWYLIFVLILDVILLIVRLLSKNPNIDFIFLITLPSVLIIGAEYFFMLKPLAESKIQVFSDKILIKRGKKEINIPYDDIVKLESAVEKNFGGWFKIILKNKKSYRFTVVLERADYLLEGINARCPHLMKKEDFEKLRTKLILCDHSFGRYYDLFSKDYFWHNFGLYILLPLAFVISMYLKQSQDFIINAPNSYFFVMLAGTLACLILIQTPFIFLMNYLADKKMKLRLLEDPTNKLRDKIYDSQLYKKIIPPYLCTILLGMIYVAATDYNAFTSVNIVSEFLQIKEGSYEVDKRYNCVDCRYNLKKGDIVYTYRGYIGKIVAMPSERVVVNLKQQGRYIASTEEVVIPEDQFAFVYTDGKVVIKESFSEVLGKVKID